jgi:hypothetical protein
MKNEGCRAEASLTRHSFMRRRPAKAGTESVTRVNSIELRLGTPFIQTYQRKELSKKSR